MAHGKWYSFVKSHSERAKTFGLTESFTEEEWESLLASSNQACMCCGRTFDEIVITADHVIPLACGGTSTIDNIQILCRNCNSQKYTKTIDYRGSNPVISSNPKRIFQPKRKPENTSNQISSSSRKLTVRSTLAEFWKQKETERSCKITVAEVASATGLARNTIDAWLENNMTRYDKPVIDALCKFFHVESGDIPFLRYEKTE